MSKSLVGRSHLVDVVTLLDDAALTLERIDELVGHSCGHAHAVTAGSERRRPAERERELTVGRDRHGNRIGRAADATRLHLDLRLHVVDGSGENLESVGVLLLVLDELFGRLLDRFLELVDGAVDDLFGGRLLAILHHHTDHVGDELRIVLRIEIGRAHV